MASATSIKLDDSLKERIQNLAEARQRSSHWIMREAIAQYVEREEKREALRQETLKAWQEFQQTGMHATAEEVDQWLASWALTPTCPPPNAASNPRPAAIRDRHRLREFLREKNPTAAQHAGDAIRWG
ncbi:Predicted transcriptional regulator [Pannonibacter indicus]|uniref:Predicted transcriptional regulator n=1 Tax=Pannonibacter indicus TaxID=466044 RepID=A0A0K6I3J5_9HYPH|nr:Predicted transcriptional regulator [Pannonibacter indicus]